MAIIGSLFALAGRFAGKLVNALLGWATVLLFGRVEARKQTILGFVALGSLAWVATLVGLVVPDVGTFVIAAVPRPDFVPEEMVRIGMLLAALVIPLAIGVTGIWLADARSRPQGFGLISAVLRGYPFTALLALMMAFLAVIAFTRKISSLRRRWNDAHLPLIVKPGAYDGVVEELVDVLGRAGIDVVVRPAPDVISLPPRLLDRVAGRGLGGMVPDRLVLLVAPGLEILVYPSDLAFSGERDVLARARAAVLSRLTRAPAWLTMSREAQDVEDAIDRIARSIDDGRLGLERVRGPLAELDERLATIVIPFDDWETIYRMRLQVERDALRGTEHVAGVEPEAQASVGPVRMERRGSPRPEAAPPKTAPPASRGRLIGMAGGIGLAMLMVADIVILLFARDGRSRRAGRARR
jgi:hypothetical protein